MTRPILSLILGLHFLCVAAGCHSMDYHRRPRSDDQPDPNYGMTSLPVGNPWTGRFVPNWFFDWIYESAQIAQSADR